MNPAAWNATLPLVCLAATAVALMILIGIHRRHGPAVFMAAAGLVAALLLLPDLSGGRIVSATPLLIFDSYGVFYIFLFCGGGLATVLLAEGYLRHYDGNREEFYLLVLLAVLGGAILAVSSHFASLFLGLEILSVSLYALITYPNRTEAHVEAAVKYLILAAASSAFLLFGMALFYAGSGSMRIETIPALLAASAEPSLPWWTAGTAMLLVAIGFKLAVVPFHMWTPDVYQGAPAPIAAFVATVSKGAVVALLFRMFPHDQLTAWLYAAFVAAAVASMIAGNLLALMQQNVKRILGYSSIAHMGYLLVAFVAGGPSAADAAAFYLATYFVTTLGAFGVVTLISSPDGDAEALDNYRGLFWRRPLLAGVFALMVLSLAGLPLTAGFQGKFALIYAGVAGARWMPVIVLVCTSTVGLYYYLRIVAVLFARSPERSGTMRHLPLFGRLAVAGLTLAVLWLGILPGAVIDAIRAMM
jgi:NADH-quinone oxidoreductase subunit N